jgi:hypothetical protein
VQDVEVRGIRPERYTQAIKIAGCKARKRHPGASREVLARATAASLKRRTATEHSHAPELRGEAVPGGRYQAAATGPFCAATAPARAAARSMPREQSGPARGMPEKRATGAYIAPVGRGKARSTADAPARVSGAFLALREASCGPACLALRPLQATARGGARKASVATMPPEACRRGRDLAAPHSLPCRPPRCRPPWPAPPRGLQTQVCAAHSAAKRFHARMFRARSHVEGEQ